MNVIHKPYVFVPYLFALLNRIYSIGIHKSYVFVPDLFALLNKIYSNGIYKPYAFVSHDSF